MVAEAFYVSDDDPPSKREILKAALKLFARDGVDGTNVRSIAAEAGYTNPALFKFFDGKESLAIFLFERCYRECLTAMRGRLEGHSAFGPRMHATVRGFAEFIDAHPDAFFFVNDHVRMLWSKVSEETRRHSIVGEYRKLLLAGRREGVVGRSVRVEVQLAAVTGFLFQMARLSYFGDLKGGMAAHVDEIDATIARILT